MNRANFSCLFVFLAFPVGVMAQQPTDSIQTRQLDEVKVTAKTQVETPVASLFLPTKLQKKHSTNGFQLLDLLQIPQLEVSLLDYAISIKGGGELVVCIDGREATMEEVRTLRANRIKRVEYTRTPSGKYVGKAGLLNFVTDLAEGGGNIYLSAEQGMAYKKGDYLAFADYTRGKSYFSTLIFQNWSRNHDYTEGKEHYKFTNGDELSRIMSNKGNLNSDNSFGGRLKYTHTTPESTFNSYLNFVYSASPSHETVNEATYAGKYIGKTQKYDRYYGRAWTPTLYIDYQRSLPHNQNWRIILNAGLGREKTSLFNHEDNQSDLWTDASEHTHSVSAVSQYSKYWEGGWSGDVQLSHGWKHYDDEYLGTSPSSQSLTTQNSYGALSISRSTEKYYGYLSAGISNIGVNLNGDRQHYLHPVLYYGGNYVLNEKSSVSLNGEFTHTEFTPSNKNSVVVPVSFFESVVGNPNIKPIKVMTNRLSYNTSVKGLKLSGTYLSLCYFDNELDRFSLDESRIYRMRVNNSFFCGNHFILELSHNFFQNHLLLTTTVQQEFNYLRGDDYHLSKSILRYGGNVTYLVGDFRINARFTSGYHALDIREPFFVRIDPRYSFSVQWTHQDWSLTFAAQNVFKRYFEQQIHMDYGQYQREVVRAFEAQGRCLNLTVAYNFGFGRKHQAGSQEVDKKIESAILKP